MSSQRVTLGVDIGGSAVRVATSNGVPDRVARIAMGRDTTLDEILHGLVSCVSEVSGGEIDAMAVAVPSFVLEDGTIGPCPALPALTGVHLGPRIAAVLPVRRVQLLPDLAAAAMGEYRRGSGRDVRRFLCVALGTGANAAAIVDGHVVDTAFGCLGDAGHVMVEPDGPECACGGRGCLEAVASGWALRQAATAQGLPVGPALTVTALAGDDRARRLYERAGVALGRAMSSWSVMLWPDLIAVAGGVSGAGELLLAPARAELQRLAPPYVVSRVRVVRAELGDLATLTGATLLAAAAAGASPAT